MLGGLRTVLRTVRVAVVSFLAIAAGSVESHGVMREPITRNANAKHGCEHCLNGGGPWAVYGNKQWPNGANRGVCGDGTTSGSTPALYCESGGAYESETGMRITHYHAGGTITVRGEITANHLGYMQLELCILPPTSKGGVQERAFLTNDCFKKNPKLQVMQETWSDRYYVASTLRKFEFPAKLPAGVECARCVIRWYYMSGNSCTPPGTPAKWAKPGLGICGSGVANPEEFWNCADVALLKPGQQLPPVSRTVLRGTLSNGAPTTDAVITPEDGEQTVEYTDPADQAAAGEAAGATNNSVVSFPDVMISVAVGTGLGVPVLFISPLIGTTVGLLGFVIAMIVFMIKNSSEKK